MKIAIDGSRLSKTPMGVTDICISIINAYAGVCPQHEFYVITHGELHPDAKAKLIMRKNIHIICKPLPILKNNSFLWTLTKFNQLLRNLDPEVLIAPNFWINTLNFPRKPLVLLYVHDLVYRKYKSTMNRITKTQFDLFFEPSLKRADLVWVNSAYTQSEFEQYYGSLHKQVYTGSGINPGFIRRVQQAEVTAENLFTKQCGSNKQYLIFVGTIEPRKNLIFLLQLFRTLATQGYYLVIVGDMGWGEAQGDISRLINEEGYPKDRIFITGYITTDELIGLYKGAFAFISTSFNEGLGLPLLEAMVCGCPVIAAHNSAMIEVAGNAGITVEGWEQNDWIAAVDRIATEREHFIAKGYKRTEKYSWKHLLEKLSVIIEQQLKAK